MAKPTAEQLRLLRWMAERGRWVGTPPFRWQTRRVALQRAWYAWTEEVTSEGAVYEITGQARQALAEATGVMCDATE